MSITTTYQTFTADNHGFWGTGTGVPPITCGDGFVDDRDNSILTPNADQRDSDGYGNIIDADLNQDRRTAFFDLSIQMGCSGKARGTRWRTSPGPGPPHSNVLFRDTSQLPDPPRLSGTSPRDCRGAPRGGTAHTAPNAPIASRSALRQPSDGKGKRPPHVMRAE